MEEQSPESTGTRPLEAGETGECGPLLLQPLPKMTITQLLGTERPRMDLQGEQGLCPTSVNMASSSSPWNQYHLCCILCADSTPTLRDPRKSRPILAHHVSRCKPKGILSQAGQHQGTPN